MIAWSALIPPAGLVTSPRSSLYLVTTPTLLRQSRSPSSCSCIVVSGFRLCRRLPPSSCLSRSFSSHRRGRVNRSRDPHDSPHSFCCPGFRAPCRPPLSFFSALSSFDSLVVETSAYFECIKLGGGEVNLGALAGCRLQFVMDILIVALFVFDFHR